MRFSTSRSPFPPSQKPSKKVVLRGPLAGVQAGQAGVFPKLPTNICCVPSRVPDTLARRCWGPDTSQIPLGPPCCCCRRLEMLGGAACSGMASQLLLPGLQVNLPAGSILCSCPRVFRPFAHLPPSFWQSSGPEALGSFPLGCHEALGIPYQASVWPWPHLAAFFSLASSSLPGEAPPSRLKPAGYRHIISFLCAILLP